MFLPNAKSPAIAKITNRASLLTGRFTLTPRLSKPRQVQVTRRLDKSKNLAPFCVRRDVRIVEQLRGAAFRPPKLPKRTTSLFWVSESRWVIRPLISCLCQPKNLRLSETMHLQIGNREKLCEEILHTQNTLPLTMTGSRCGLGCYAYGTRGDLLPRLRCPRTPPLDDNHEIERISHRLAREEKQSPNLKAGRTPNQIHAGHPRPGAGTWRASARAATGGSAGWPSLYARLPPKCASR